MRLGGPSFLQTDDPKLWAKDHIDLGYSAAWLPLSDPHDPRLESYVREARAADLVIAEVGAWSNPISPNPRERAQAIDLCGQRLELAERLGARCCVNIAGSLGERWDGPHPDNLSAACFDLIVCSIRQIIDMVKPRRTFYTLETMPWIFPDSPDSYLRLLRAVDRQAFAVHLDPVNMINCPARAYRSGDFLRECFAKLGPYIRSCHAKDIRFTQHLTLHLDECRPGTGVLDYPAYLQELSHLAADVPLMLEHLSSAEEYAQAAQFIRQIVQPAKEAFR